MINTSVALLSSLGLFFGMLIGIAIGRQFGFRHREVASDSAQTAYGLIDGAVFGLLGLLIAFTFSGAVSRFDHRRELVMAEANAIGTAYLRIDVLPTGSQPPLRALFRQYLDTRLEAYRKLPDLAAAKSTLERANTLQRSIWSAAVKACQESGSVSVTSLVLSSLNEMFDIATLRTATALMMHPPIVILVMLFGVALVGSILAGHALAGAKVCNWMHVAFFALIIAGTAYVILDMEFPRLGVIRVDAVDQLLVDVRRGMN